MKRLNLDDPNVWNLWRELYYDLTEAENIQFGNDIFARYPGQASFNPFNFDFAIKKHLERLPVPPKVLEVGGWRGELAQHCFSKHEIWSWHNIDMCKAAVDNSLPIQKHDKCSPGYTSFFPGDFDWFKKPRLEDYDMFVSAHTIEHLTDDHFLQLMDYAMGIPIVLLEAPITNEGQKWDGYIGTHIMEMGWERVHKEMAARGWKNKMPLNAISWLYELEE